MHLYPLPGRTHLCQGCLPYNWSSFPALKTSACCPAVGGGRNCPI